jgi:glutathione S-transferase
MILYHFSTSPFARRVRLTLALKGLSAELRDARRSPEAMAEVRRLNPLHTVPVLVDGERVVTDSGAICQYLDRKAPEPALWPSGLEGAEAFDLVALTDSIMTALIDLGMRYSPLHDHAQFEAVRGEYVGRVQRGLDHLARRVDARGQGTGLYEDRWSGADIAVYTTAAWLEGLEARAATFPLAKKVIDLGWSLPPSLHAWAARHRERDDVRALDAASTQ